MDYKANDGYVTRSIVEKGVIITAPGKSLHSFIRLLKESMYLETPCPGSKFRVSFKPPKTLGKGGYDQDDNETIFADDNA